MSAAKAVGEKGIRCESGAIQSLCTGADLHNHWETGKGRAAMIEVRRPALAWNLKSAGLRVDLPASLTAPGLSPCAQQMIRLGRAAAETQPFFIFLSEQL